MINIEANLSIIKFRNKNIIKWTLQGILMIQYNVFLLLQ